MNKWKKLLHEECGVAPVPVIWIIICVIVGGVAGIAAYLVTQACVTILTLIVVIALFAYVGAPLFPKLSEMLKGAGRKLRETTESEKAKKSDNDETETTT